MTYIILNPRSISECIISVAWHLRGDLVSGLFSVRASPHNPSYLKG